MLPSSFQSALVFFFFQTIVITHVHYIHNTRCIILYYYDYEGVSLLHRLPLRPTHYLTGGPLFRLCGLIHVCEEALLVSQTLNRALALISANL